MSEAARLEWYGDKVLSSTKAAKKAALTLGCQVVNMDAVYRAPVLTGNLRDSITYNVSEEEGRIGTNVEYAEFVEMGTKKMSAQPYLRPALDNNRANILKAMGEILGKAAEAGGNK